MKRLIFLFVLSFGLAINPLTKTFAQDPVTVVTVGATVTKQLYNTVSFLHSHWVYISWCFTGMHHTWWAAIYQDGFVTQNNFRSYRDLDNVYSYFALGTGDCDAVYDDVYGNERHICYQSSFQARYYSQQHGPIVDIQFQGNDGRYHSVLQY